MLTGVTKAASPTTRFILLQLAPAHQAPQQESDCNPCWSPHVTHDEERCREQILDGARTSPMSSKLEVAPPPHG